MTDMVNVRFFIGIFIILYGTATIFAVGCNKQESAKLTITIESKELSDAHVYIDGKYVGNLVQTIMTADGKIYINGNLAARLHHQESVQGSDTYTGSLDSLQLDARKYTITLQKGNAQPLTIILNITPGYHLLAIFPEKGLVRWDQKTIPIDSTNTVTQSPEKNK